MPSKTPRPGSTARGYDAQWQRLRRRILADEPLCRYCHQLGKLTPATVVDHIVPLREAPHRRLDPTNLQPLCKRCHDVTKAKEEQRGYALTVGADGWPIDQRHPANRRG